MSKFLKKVQNSEFIFYTLVRPIRWKKIKAVDGFFIYLILLNINFLTLEKIIFISNYSKKKFKKS